MDQKTQKNLRDLARLSPASTVYVVGGTLRDYFLGKTPADFDFAVQNAPRLAELFAAHIKRHPIRLHDTPGRETLRVVMSGGVFFDFSEMQGNKIQQDLAGRDFTINAMAVPLEEYLEADWKPLDPFKGRADLERKIVRVLPGPIFKSDPLRVIRAFRFSGTLGFDIEDNTLDKIAEAHTGLKFVAAERIANELLLFLNSKKVFPLARVMSRTGVLGQLIPAIHAPGGNPAKARETLETLESLEEIILHPAKVFPDKFPGVERYLEGNKPGLLKLAALSYPLNEEKKSSAGAAAAAFLKNLRLSNADIRFIRAVLEHQQTALTTKLDFAGPARDLSRIYSFVKNSGAQLVPALLLAAARLARSGENDIDSFIRAIHNLVEFFQRRYLPAQGQRALLTGDDLIRQFNLSPSPVFKTILDRVEEARVLGSITTREEAEALARRLIQTLAQA
ncbi:MAG: hypothetical protein ACE5G9_00510 [Nitrospinales bacterium]